MNSPDERIDKTRPIQERARLRCKVCDARYHTKNLGGYIGARGIFTDSGERTEVPCTHGIADLEVVPV